MLLEKEDWSNGDYLSAHDSDHSPAISFTRRDPLTPLEQSVVVLSLFDHRSSIEPPGRLARFLAWVSGSRPPNQLADERLEALRRYCVLLRVLNDTPPAEEGDRVRGAGFTEAALKEAGRLIALGRSRH